MKKNPIYGYAANRFVAIVLGLAVPGLSFAATEAPPAAPPTMWGMEELLQATLLLLIALLFIKIIAEIVMIRAAIHKLRRTILEDKGLPIPESLTISWAETFRRYFSGLKPIELEGDLIIEDHEYDGIHELNNGMPPWLKYLFTVTIVFAIVYVGYYMVYSESPNQFDEYAAEMNLAKIEKEERRKTQANAMDENTVIATTEASELAQGQSVYETNCASCHGNAGEGGIGPNLTDGYWLHGGGIKNIFKTIKYGVQGKGMVAWESIISPGDIQKVASYILTLEGTNPPNAKAPQGELWAETGDSTQVLKSDSIPVVIDTLAKK